MIDLQPDDSGFGRSPALPVELLYAQEVRDWSLQFNDWLRRGFVENESGQLIGWLDPGPEVGDADKA